MLVWFSLHVVGAVLVLCKWCSPCGVLAVLFLLCVGGAVPIVCWLCSSGSVLVVLCLFCVSGAVLLYVGGAVLIV